MLFIELTWMWLGRQFKDAMTPENNTSSTMGSSRLESHKSLHIASCLTSQTWPQTPPKTTARTSRSNMVENGKSDKTWTRRYSKGILRPTKQGFQSNKFPASQITTATADDTWCITTPFCALRIRTCMSSCDVNCLYPFPLNVAEPLFFSIKGGGFYCARNGTGTISEVIRIMH